MKGNKAQIKKDIERFNQQYSVGAVITNSANGVIYHAKRKSDGFICVVKVSKRFSIFGHILRNLIFVHVQ